MDQGWAEYVGSQGLYKWVSGYSVYLDLVSYSWFRKLIFVYFLMSAVVYFVVIFLSSSMRALF